MMTAIEAAILKELERGQPLKARAIARSTNLPVRDVNSVLYGTLREEVEKNHSHEWTLREEPLRALNMEMKTAASLSASKPKFTIKSHVVKEK